MIEEDIKQQLEKVYDDNPNNLDWSDKHTESKYDIKLTEIDNRIPEVIATLSNEETLDDLEFRLDYHLKDLSTDTLVGVALNDGFGEGDYTKSIVNYLLKNYNKYGQIADFICSIEDGEDINLSLVIDDRMSFLDYLLFHRRNDLDERTMERLENLLMEEEVWQREIHD